MEGSVQLDRKRIQNILAFAQPILRCGTAKMMQMTVTTGNRRSLATILT